MRAHGGSFHLVRISADEGTLDSLRCESISADIGKPHPRPLEGATRCNDACVSKRRRCRAGSWRRAQLWAPALLTLLRLITVGEIAPSSCLTVTERATALHVQQLESDPQHYK